MRILSSVGGFSEPVSDAAYGGDEVGAELASQVSDVDVDDVGAAVEVVSPDPAEKLLA